ncbi:hypothetical protein HY640_02340 [Candidatus Woesearchaeota archaeon]|nr:hypothetical protein [Candidatus Woesearchaeota archaeon]
MSKKLALVVLLFALGVADARALGNDFFAYSSSRLDVCGCSSYESRLYVRNSGDFGSFYSVEVSGSGAGFVSLFPSAFYLEPGEEAYVSEFISAPCRSGDFDVALEIESGLGLSKSMTQQLHVSACRNIDSRLVFSNSSGCCGHFSYGFSVRNTGGFVEQYLFSASRFGESVRMFPESSFMPPGEFVRVDLVFSPGCPFRGSFDFVASAVSSGFVQRVPLSVDAFCPVNASVSNVSVSNYSGMPAVKVLSDSLLFLPLAFLLVLVVVLAAFMLRKKPAAAKRGPELRKPYFWRERFAGHKVPVPEPAKVSVSASDNVRSAVAAFVIVAMVIFIGFVSFGVFAPFLMNQSNQSDVSIPYNVSSGNVSNASAWSPFDVFSARDLWPGLSSFFEGHGNLSSGNYSSNYSGNYASSLVSSYGWFVVFGAVLLVLVIASLVFYEGARHRLLVRRSFMAVFVVSVLVVVGVILLSVFPSGRELVVGYSRGYVPYVVLGFSVLALIIAVLEARARLARVRERKDEPVKEIRRKR